MSAATVAFLAKYNHRTGGVKRSQGHTVLRAAVHGRRARGCERSAASRAANQASGAPRSGACCGRADGHRGPRAVGIAGTYVERSPGRLWPALVPVGVHAPATLYEKRSELQICLASGCGSLSGANQSTNQEAVKSGRSLRTGPHLFRSAGDCDRLLSDLKATYNGTSLASVTLINCAPPPHASCQHCTHDQS